MQVLETQSCRENVLECMTTALAMRIETSFKCNGTVSILCFVVHIEQIKR